MIYSVYAALRDGTFKLSLLTASQTAEIEVGPMVSLIMLLLSLSHVPVYERVNDDSCDRSAVV